MSRLAVLALCVLPAGLAARQTAPAFEVASVRPSSDDHIAFSSVARLPPNRYRAITVNVVHLIGNAYPEYAFAGRVVGGPEWMRSERFHLEAVKEPKTTPAQVTQMVAHLLANRFALRTRVEPRPVDVYVLKMARADGRFGPQLKRSASSCIEAQTANNRFRLSVGGQRPPECTFRSGRLLISWNSRRSDRSIGQ
jgi:uncharacterized protein (TIGR03435 family)